MNHFLTFSFSQASKAKIGVTLVGNTMNAHFIFILDASDASLFHWYIFFPEELAIWTFIGLAFGLNFKFIFSCSCQILN